MRRSTRTSQAFRRGRQFISDPAAFHDAAGSKPAAEATVPPHTRRLVELVRAQPGSELARLVAIRVPDLVAYQSAGYARSYAEFVEWVRRAEAARWPESTAVVEAVARGLYKLMAYKDEYEVARLSLTPEVAAAVAEQFGPGAKVAYRLHPPVVRALGRRTKITLGPWFQPVFRLLVTMRRVRGTPLDLFGYTELRRIERGLIAEYRDVIGAALGPHGPADAALIVAIAELPDVIRGYEAIKRNNIGKYHHELAALRSQLAESLNGRAA